MKRPTNAQYLYAARAEYVTDDIEIDDCAKCSKNDEGSWVAAWVWVSDELAQEHSK